MAAKIVLAQLPLGYGFWRRAALFRHGNMDSPEYALQVFRKHFEAAQQFLPTAREELILLELGPGDSLFTALIARSFGFSASLLVDAGNFASAELAAYRAMAAHLAKQELVVPDLGTAADLDGILRSCRARYLHDGQASLAKLPAESVDFIWSNAVLEHVRRRDFLPTLRELRRVLRNDGVCSHRIDLKDHLGGALNNLRFADRFWEDDRTASCGFYTNRIRFSEMLALFTEAGFRTDITLTERWDSLPTPRSSMAAQWQGLPAEELLVSGFEVILHPV